MTSSHCVSTSLILVRCAALLAIALAMRNDDSNDMQAAEHLKRKSTRVAPNALGSVRHADHMGMG